MPTYRIPLNDKHALSLLVPAQEVGRDGKVKVKGKVVVKKWTVVIPDNVAIVETTEEVKGLEKYKA